MNVKSLLSALGLCVAIAFPASAQTLPVFKKAIDFRRNAAQDTQIADTYVNPVDVTNSTVISITTPVSGTTTARLELSPVTDPSGTKCPFYARANGTGNVNQNDNKTDGTGWVKNKRIWVLDPAASDGTARWVAFKAFCPTGQHAQFTASWQTMIAQ